MLYRSIELNPRENWVIKNHDSVKNDWSYDKTIKKEIAKKKILKVKKNHLNFWFSLIICDSLNDGFGERRLLDALRCHAQLCRRRRQLCDQLRHFRRRRRRVQRRGSCDVISALRCDEVGSRGHETGNSRKSTQASGVFDTGNGCWLFGAARAAGRSVERVLKK